MRGTRSFNTLYEAVPCVGQWETTRRFIRLIPSFGADFSSQPPVFGILPSRPHSTLTAYMADKQGHREGVRVVRANFNPGTLQTLDGTIPSARGCR